MCIVLLLMHATLQVAFIILFRNAAPADPRNFALIVILTIPSYRRQQNAFYRKLESRLDSFGNNVIRQLLYKCNLFLCGRRLGQVCYRLFF